MLVHTIQKHRDDAMVMRRTSIYFAVSEVLLFGARLPRTRHLRKACHCLLNRVAGVVGI